MKRGSWTHAWDIWSLSSTFPLCAAWENVSCIVIRGLRTWDRCFVWSNSSHGGQGFYRWLSEPAVVGREGGGGVCWCLSAGARMPASIRIRFADVRICLWQKCLPVSRVHEACCSYSSFNTASILLPHNLMSVCPIFPLQLLQNVRNSSFCVATDCGNISDTGYITSEG